MKIREALGAAQSSMAAREIPDARIEAELLLMYSMGMNRVELYTELERPLSDFDMAAYWRLVERRLRHEPAAYITQEVQFYDIDLYVDSRVLIPRPETEMLVEMAVDFLSGRRPDPAVVADVGTGSGAIAVTIARLCPTARVYAMDISVPALEVARLNVIKHEVQDRVRLLQGNLLDPLPEAVDLMIANLPYVSQEEFGGLMPEVRDFEPEMALNGGVDGLDIVRLLMLQAGSRLLPGGLLLAEIGQGQYEAVAALARSWFSGCSVDVFPDMAGIDRVVAISMFPVFAG